MAMAMAMVWSFLFCGQMPVSVGEHPFCGWMVGYLKQIYNDIQADLFVVVVSAFVVMISIIWKIRKDSDASQAQVLIIREAEFV
mmetsp:Transcript_30043/g.69304  ORF Transcript_30043/g.69304 Transcript_30043/m.69304 type:complete len:84 (-) Transcript_30043:42-293(-)